jgi:PAS domain S-box-containing protein
LALQATSSPRREIALAWQRFVESGVLLEDVVREVIAASWQRCRRAGVNPYGGKGPLLPASRLEARRRSNAELIRLARPFMEDLLRVVGSGFIVILADAEGYLLEVAGDPQVAQNTRELNFVPGAHWVEETVGTNAIGTALKVKAPLQVWAEEHYCRLHHPWTCSAAPILGPDGSVSGILNMTGPCGLVHAHTLGMVVAAARAIENGLRWEKASRELEISHNLLTSTFSSISEGLLTVDTEGRITQANGAAAELLGLTVAELKDRFLPKLMANPARLIRALEGAPGYSDQESVLLTPKGRLHCTCTACPITGPDGRTEGLVITLRESRSVHRLAGRLAGYQANFTFDQIVGSSRSLRAALELAKHAADTSLAVLIQGETGTGKEMVAQAIHNASARSRGPFVAINCGALPRELIESELFGYEGGAFTGARKEGRPGKFELADGGTIFLDEVGEMPLEMQVRFLRVLQEKKVVRLGGREEIPVDVRVIAATNRDLAREVARGNFRRDLYYRLNVIEIRLPALRERPEDIPLLARHLLGNLRKRLGKPELELTPEVEAALVAYSWPGNVRELENVLERAAHLATGPIRLEHLPGTVTGKEDAREIGLTPLEEAEKEAILNALVLCRGNISRAARQLGIGRATLYRRLQRWRLRPEDVVSERRSVSQ